MPTDQELTRRYVNDADHAAFAALVERHGHLVFAAARRQCPEEADDVTQAVFLLLARKAPGLGRQVSLTGWLLRATTYCSANARKLNARRKRHEQEAAMQRESRAAEASALPSDDDALLSRLDEAIQRLPAKYREAVILRYLEGRSNEEVGELLGLSVDAAGKRATRGLQRLRDFFSRSGHPATGESLTGLLIQESGARASDAVLALASSAGSAAGAGTAGATAIAAAAGQGMMASAVKVAALTVAALLVGLAGIVATASVLLSEGSVPATGGTSAPILADFPVPSPVTEATVPGANLLGQFVLLLNAPAANELANVTQPIDAPPGFFTVRRGAASDVFAALRKARDAGDIVVYDNQMFHGHRPTGWPVTQPYSLHVPQFWKYLELDGLSFLTGLTWSNRPGATMLEVPGGLRVHLHDEQITTNLDESSEQSPGRAGNVAIDVTTILAPGEAVVLLGDYGPLSGRHFMTASVWHAYRASDLQLEHLRRVRTAEPWLRLGPGGGRTLADRAIAWAPARPRKVSERWTRKLQNSAIVRLVATGRPSTWPFCWWDGDGNPVAGDWTELGAGLDLAKAVVLSVDWPANDSGYRNARYLKDGEAHAVPVEDQQVTLWVAAGPWKEQRVAPGDVVKIGDGAVHFERAMTAGNDLTFGILRGDLGADVEVWLDAVSASGTRITSHSGQNRAIKLVTTTTQRWKEESENLPVKAADVDHYLLRWRPRQPAIFEGLAETPNPLPPPVAGGEGDKVTR